MIVHLRERVGLVNESLPIDMPSHVIMQENHPVVNLVRPCAPGQQTGGIGAKSAE